jgi:hypothetical protein
MRMPSRFYDIIADVTPLFNLVMHHHRYNDDFLSSEDVAKCGSIPSFILFS